MASAEKSDSQFPVSVVMERRPRRRSRWQFIEWKAIGVLTDTEHVSQARDRSVIHEDEEFCRVLWTGFRLRLVKDGAESYWSNLMGEQPSLFVVCRRDEGSDEPEPFMVTVNYDDIIGHQEVDDDVYRLPMPADVHQWVERYVVNNYIPRQTKKRKRANWSAAVDEPKTPGRRQH